MRAFAAERDWEPFHTPKTLAMALTVEAAELLEHFQWLTPEASIQLAPEARAGVREELADALRPLGACPRSLPLSPDVVWALARASGVAPDSPG